MVLVPQWEHVEEMCVLLGHVKRVTRILDKRTVPSVFFDESRYGLGVFGDEFEPACASVQSNHRDLVKWTVSSKLLLPLFQLKGHGGQQRPSCLIGGPLQKAQELIASIGTVFDILNCLPQLG
jgi:hypothetical protein